MKTKEIILPDDWDVKEVVGNKIIIKEKEKELPKTWRECFKPCEAECLDSTSYRNAVPSNLKNPMLALCQLLVCRNAWWKQLGWKPDLRNDSDQWKYCIGFASGKINSETNITCNKILAFPTSEVRDQFLDSFRDLIEEAKELL